MSPLEFLCQPIWQRLGLALLHFLWQGVVIATAVLAVVYLLRLRHGNARYAVYLLGFIAMSVCPLVTFTMLETPELAAAVPVVSQGGSEPVDSSAYTPVPSSPVRQAPLGSDVSPAEQDTVVAAEVLVPLRQRISEYLQRLLPWGVLGWFAGVVVLSVRLLLGFVGMHRWRRRIEQLPRRLRERVAVLSGRLGMNSFSRVFVSPAALEAVAIGYLRPMVLLPVSMVTQMPPEMLEAVIAHELAHIRRFDLWVNLFQRVAETLLFYHPAVWWLSSRVRAEREFCCDEMAVKATRQRATYASALENVARARPLFKPPALAAGLGRGDKPILGRVRNVLGLAPTHQNSRFWVAGMIAMLLLAALAIPTAIALAQSQTGRTAGGTPEGASAVEAGTRVIHSSKDQSMGTLGSSETSAQQLSLAEYLKDWPGQGTMKLRAQPATVAQRQEAGLAETTIGTVISTVREGPARDAGLQVGDFIVRVAGIDVRSHHHLIALTGAMAPGTKVNVEFVRWGEKMAVEVVLARLTWKDDYPVLAGSVHLPNAQPAAGTMVYACVHYDRERISSALPYLTDVRGRFIARFSSRAEPGRCFLLATTYDGYAGHAVVDFPIKAPIEIRLEKGMVTEGRLYTDKGEGLPDMFMEVGRIVIPGAGGDFRAGYYELRTDDNGSFVLPAFPVGSKVELDFAVPGYARPSRGPYDLNQLQEGLLFGAGGIPPGAVIEGVVIASDTGEPLGPFSLAWRNDSAKVGESIQVDFQGRFRADTLPAGQTTLYIDEYQMRDLRYTVTEKVLDLQPRQEVTGLRLSAEPFGVVTGKVTDRATKTGLADFRITAWNETFPAEVFDTTTDVDGTYRLAIPAGNIRFSLPKGRGKQIRIAPAQTIDNVDFVAKAPSEQATVDGSEAGTRVIRFPKDRSMGVVYAGELRPTDPLWWQGWEEIGQAKGDVAVPADKDVRLTVNTNGVENLSFLEALGPDDIQALNFVYPLKRLDDKGLVHLAGLTGLRLLRLDGASIRGEGLRHLTKLKKLEALHAPSTEISDEGLRHVGQIGSLLSLSLGMTPVTDKGLAHLRDLSSLRFIGLGQTSITGTGFSHLAGLKSLTYAHLCDSGLTDEGLREVANLKSLEILRLEGTKVTDRGIAHLEDLTRLRELHLTGTDDISDASLEHIGKITSLENLDLPDGVTDAGLRYLTSLNRLKRLNITRMLYLGGGLEPLKSFEKLECLLPPEVTDEDLAVLGTLSSLQELTINNSPITNKGLAHLAGLKSLKKLWLHNGHKAIIMDVTVSGLAALKGIPLTYLHLWNIRLDESRLESLGGFPTLEELNLKQMPICDEDLAVVGKLSQLTWLTFTTDTVSDGGLEYLAGLTCLEDFQPITPLTDKGLYHIGKMRMKQLGRLVVKGHFTDEGLRHLEDLSSLRQLKVTTSGEISPEARERLRRKLPNLSYCSVGKSPEVRQRPKVGEAAPPFALKPLDDDSDSDEEIRLEGKAVLLYFWATWCAPCKASTPALKQLYAKLKKRHGDRFVMLGLSLESNKTSVRRYVEIEAIPWPQICISRNSQTAVDYGVASVPMYYVIGPDGRIAFTDHDDRGDSIEAAVGRVLSE